MCIMEFKPGDRSFCFLFRNKDILVLAKNVIFPTLFAVMQPRTITVPQPQFWIGSRQTCWTPSELKYFCLFGRKIASLVNLETSLVNLETIQSLKGDAIVKDLTLK